MTLCCKTWVGTHFAAPWCCLEEGEDTTRMEIRDVWNFHELELQSSSNFPPSKDTKSYKERETLHSSDKA